jgi:hypothetical protein
MGSEDSLQQLCEILRLNGFNKEEEAASSAALPRRPRKHNKISTSMLRPHVLASDRLLQWSTPYSIAFRKRAALFVPPASHKRLFEVMTLSLDKNTRNGYGAGLLRFNQFCDLLVIPEENRMPASELLLTLFVTDAAGRVSDSTINTWLAALHFWHIINNARWAGKEMLTQARKGAKKLVPASSKRQKRPLVTYEHLCSL